MTTVQTERFGIGRPRGYFGIGIYCPKTSENVGTLLRSAQAFGAGFTFVIGAKGLHRQASNTTKAHLHVPHHEYPSLEEFLRWLPIERTIVSTAVTSGGWLLYSLSFKSC